MTKNEQLLAVAFLALLVFPVLYLFRAFDDNTLTSWQWVFENGGMLRTFGFVACGVAAAFLLARAKATERAPGLLLFVLSFLIIVPLWREPETILDASRYFVQAKHLELYGPASFLREWGAGVSAWTDMPVVPFLYGLLFRYAGEARLVIQVFTTLLFSLAVLLTYHTGRKLWNGETGFLAGLLLLGNPFLLTQVPLMLVDVPVMFFLVLALSAFLAALERGGAPRIILAALSALLCLFSKYSAPFLLLVLPVAALVFLRGNARTVLRRSAAVFAAVAVFSLGIGLAEAGVIARQLELLRTYQLPGLSTWGESPVSTYLFQVHPFLAVLAIAAVVVAVRTKDARFLIPAWFVVIGLRVERVRYVLPLFPLLALAAAYGLRVFREKEVRAFIAFSAVATALVLAVTAYLPFLGRTGMANLARAGSYLDTLPGGRVAVSVLPQHDSSGNTETALPILDLYTKKQLVYRREAPLPFDGPSARRSSLRFTWECPLPQFYSEGTPRQYDAIAVISGDAADADGTRSPRSGKEPLPLLRSFAAGTGAFRYKTVVMVYGERSLAERAQARDKAVLFGTTR